MRLEDTRITCLDLTIPSISLVDELSQFWIAKENTLVDINFRGYMKSIKRGFQYLAYQHERKRIDFERVCAHIGAPFLHSLPGVAEIKQARKFVIENCAEDYDDVRDFENRFFDLKTNDLGRYHGELLKDDASQITGFAEVLSINSAVAYQMAFIYPLVHANLPVRIHNKLAKVFIRFMRVVEGWGEKALKIERECNPDNRSYRIPLEDIFY